MIDVSLKVVVGPRPVCYKKCRLSSSFSQRKHEFRVVLGSSLVC